MKKKELPRILLLILIAIIIVTAIYLVSYKPEVSYAPEEKADCNTEYRKLEGDMKESCLNYCRNKYDGQDEQSCIDWVNAQRNYKFCKANNKCKGEHGGGDSDNPGTCFVSKGIGNNWYMPQCNDVRCGGGLICFCKTPPPKSGSGSGLPTS